MHRAANSVATGVAHGQALGDNALTGKRRISVKKQWQHAVSKRWIDPILSSSDHSKHDRVDRFEMAWVCRQFERQCGTRLRYESASCTEVILDVSRALYRRRVDVVLKLVEQLLIILTNYVC